MKSFFILMLISLVTACAPQKKVVKKLNIHPEARPYVATFESKWGVKISDLEVTFKAFEETSNVLAYCQKSKKTVTNGITSYVYETPLVVINSNYWKDQYTTEADKELLMYHELGHCNLNRGHLDSKINNRPLSIMNPYHIGSNLYTNYYGGYISELFKKNELAGISWDISPYTVASTLPDFKEPKIELASEHDIKDCVHELAPEVVTLKEGETITDYEESLLE